MFRYFLTKCREINKFASWELIDKAKFIGVANVIMFLIAISFPSNNIVVTFVTFFFLITSSYFMYIFSKTLLVRKMNKGLQHKKALLIQEIDQMTESEFVELLYHLFKQQGYYVNRSPGPPDYGADLILRKGEEVTVVRAIRSENKVGMSALNEVNQSNKYFHVNSKWIITNSSYTKVVINQAEKSDVKLLSREDLLDMLHRFKTPIRKSKLSEVHEKR
ncbi:restriction endonuclease [Aquibacillus koreensis]|uniref:Restriction endonuclease n=1 Tax=Aquibacillus koreensis TaxID=279446 RepID=A0A9X3WN68_9BACI|nr:restriction endonuclease [Aquibacillus koreensis]MCT2535237.1 restriction endonuclease [Aquibacillus koreensis]MDC3422852.1 restriction endonuclease [Aquibacillus koreensis]